MEGPPSPHFELDKKPKGPLSRAGLEPAPLEPKERPSELPFIQIVIFCYPVHQKRLRPGSIA